MSAAAQPPVGDGHPDREQTDESLRAERSKADLAIDERLAAIDQAADELIVAARERADALLKKERMTADKQPTSKAAGQLRAERAGADEAIRVERAGADQVVRAERAKHGELLTEERRETDKDLSSERIKSDTAISTRDDLLASVSHDLRNMLGGVMGFAALIAKQKSEPLAIVAHAERILRVGTRMNRLIGDLLDIASMEAGAFAVSRELVDPTRLVHEAVESLQPVADAQGIRLSSEVLSPRDPVSLDGARILRVLTNLVANAIKFTPRNGSVVVRVERLNDAIRFSVTDTGAGIPADKLVAIFDRFRQLESDRRGVGLGLYVSKGIVEAQGGRIWAESAVGVGSTFHFVLPV